MGLKAFFEVFRSPTEKTLFVSPLYWLSTFVGLPLYHVRTLSTSCIRSNPANERLASNISIASFPCPAKSRRPISTIVPNSAIHLQDACRSSPESELRTMSTPRLLVALRIAERKVVSLELKILSGSMPNVFTRYATFASEPTCSKSRRN